MSLAFAEAHHSREQVQRKRAHFKIRSNAATWSSACYYHSVKLMIPGRVTFILLRTAPQYRKPFASGPNTAYHATLGQVPHERYETHRYTSATVKAQQPPLPKFSPSFSKASALVLLFKFCCWLSCKRSASAPTQSAILRGQPGNETEEMHTPEKSLILL